MILGVISVTVVVASIRLDLKLQSYVVCWDMSKSNMHNENWPYLSSNSGHDVCPSQLVSTLCHTW